MNVFGNNYANKLSKNKPLAIGAVFKGRGVEFLILVI